MRNIQYKVTVIQYLRLELASFCELLSFALAEPSRSTAAIAETPAALVLDS
jgi:hypothetical protein